MVKSANFLPYLLLHLETKSKEKTMQEILDGFYKALIADDRWKLYIDGLIATLKITVVACCIGVVLGLLVAIIKVYAVGSKNPILIVLSGICGLYTTIVRGTPMTLQLLIISFGIAISPNPMISCYIAFGINSGAYVSEMFRGGINSVDVGQMEAGRSLGLSKNQTMGYIIVPQATKNILPTLFNEIISLLKETSIAGYIAVNDLTKVANGVRGRTFTIYPLLVAGIIYLVLVIGLTGLQKLVEKGFARSDRR